MQARSNNAAAMRAALRSLGGVIPRSRLHPAAVGWADGRPPGERWAVALSGGADSVALLLLIRAHWPGHRVRVLHFNHRLRGRESDADERFCRRMASMSGAAFLAGRWRLKPAGRATEAQARAARLEFFSKAMSRGGEELLWLGHQQDDIAETILMRLGRGSGTTGLSAPRPLQRLDRRWNVRPLLTLKREEIRAALRSAGIGWRDDSSNEAEHHLRNRMRLRVIRAWRAIEPGRDVLAGVCLSRERLEEDDAALEAWLDRIAPFTPAGRLRIRSLHGLPVALVRRALHRWLLVHPHGSDISRQGFEQLLRLVIRGAPTRFSLGRNGFAVIRAGLLLYSPARG